MQSNRRRKKMADTCYHVCLLIVLCIRSMQGTPLGGTEKLQNGDTFKEAQVAASTREKDNLNKKTISTLRGKEVILVVDAIGESEIQDIQWVKNGINFATSRPSESVTIRDSRYDGRLGSSTDGSLIIYHFEMEDQGEYKADILLTDLKKREIVYVLNVSEGDSPRKNHVAVAVSVIVVLLVVAAVGVAFMLWRKKKKPCANSGEIPEGESRRDPEGKSEPENEKLQLTESSPSHLESHDEFVDAKEYLEDDTKSGHT